MRDDDERSTPLEHEEVAIVEELDVLDLGEPRVLHPADELLAAHLEFRLRRMRTLSGFEVNDGNSSAGRDVAGDRLEIRRTPFDVMDDGAATPDR